MRAWLVLTTVVLVTVLVAGSASAQGPGQGPRPGGGGFGPARGFLLGNKSVQEELKLSEEQIADLKKISESDDAKALREAMGGLFRLSEEERAAKMKELAPKLEAQTKKRMEVLKDTQATRLKQIERQQGGVDAFSDEEVQKELKFSDEQKDKLKKLTADVREELASLRKAGTGGFNREVFEKGSKIRKEALTKATGLLSDDQKKQWKEMTGEAFEVKREGRGPGGRE